VSARLFAHALPAWPGARELLARGVRSTYHEQNERGRAAVLAAREVATEDRELIFDPQTSGGLLFGVDAARAPTRWARCARPAIARAAVIGLVAPVRSDGFAIELVAGQS
jgi:selenide,water dikinase